MFNFAKRATVEDCKAFRPQIRLKGSSIGRIRGEKKLWKTVALLLTEGHKTQGGGGGGGGGGLVWGGEGGGVGGGGGLLVGGEYLNKNMGSELRLPKGFQSERDPNRRSATAKSGERSRAVISTGRSIIVPGLLLQIFSIENSRTKKKHSKKLEAVRGSEFIGRWGWWGLFSLINWYCRVQGVWRWWDAGCGSIGQRCHKTERKRASVAGWDVELLINY